MTKNQDKLDIIGNSIIYLLDTDIEASLIKILIYLYLLDERSIIKSSSTFFNLNYYCADYPVDTSIYFDMTSGLEHLGKYILTYDNNKYTKEAEFNNDNFSKFDTDLMDNLIIDLKDKSDKDLISMFEGDCLLTRTKQKGNNKINFIDLLEEDKKKEAWYNRHNKIINW